MIVCVRVWGRERLSVSMCIHKHIPVWTFIAKNNFIDFFACWQMNNLKKILQKVVDYYNEVGCSRLLEGLFTLSCLNGTSPFYCACWKTQVKDLLLKNSFKQLNHGSLHDITNDTRVAWNVIYFQSSK